MAKRLPLSTGTVKSKRFDFALDDDDFEDTPEDFIARIIAPKARSNLNCCALSEQRMAKRPPLSTGTVTSKRFDFALDDNDFEDTPGNLIARVIAPKARSNLNCCILSEQRMAKRYPLSTGTVKSKRFDFTPGDLYPMSDPEFLPLRRNARSEHCCFYGIYTSFTAPLPLF